MCLYNVSVQFPASGTSVGSLPQSKDMHIRITEYAYLPVALNMKDVNGSLLACGSKRD